MLSPASHIILVAAERAFWKTISPNKGFAARLWRTVAFSGAHNHTDPHICVLVGLDGLLESNDCAIHKDKVGENERKKERTKERRPKNERRARRRGKKEIKEEK